MHLLTFMVYYRSTLVSIQVVEIGINEGVATMP